MTTWTLTDTYTGERITVDGHDLDEDALRDFLDLNPEYDEILAAGDALISYLQNPRGETAWAAPALGLDLEEVREEPSAWERRLRAAEHALTRAQADQITRERDAAAALSETGTYGDSSIVRLAYIWRTLGKRAAEQAARDADQAEQAAPEVPTRSNERADRAARRVTVEAFTRAYETAKAREREREQAIREGRIIPGRLIQAIRTSMGLDQAELAVELGVSMDTVRSWEVGRRAINAGASTDLWTMWREWLADASAKIREEGPIPSLDEDESLARIRVMLILAGGEPVTLG